MAFSPQYWLLFRRLMFGLFIVALTSSYGYAKEKLKPEELVAKHLESIGPSDALAGLDSLIAAGTVAAVPKRGGSGRMEGSFRAVSSAKSDLSLLEMLFGQPNYPFERIAFNGEDSIVAQISPGQRSALGALLNVQNRPISEGLLGGVWTARWPFYRIKERKAKLNYKGLKKVDGVEYHSLEYKPRKSSDFRITVFFDPDTFRHVRTEYRLLMSADPFRAGAGTSATSEKRFTLVEEFSDFTDLGGMNLPQSYVIHLTVEDQSTLMIDWELKASDVQVNQPVDPAIFQVTE